MKKRSFLDSGVFHFLTRIADLISVNLVFLLCSLPLITIGPALTALYYVTLRMARGEEFVASKSFFRSFCQNMRQGIAIHLIFSVVSIILALDIYVLWKFMEISWMLKYLLAIMVVIAAIHFITFLYVYPVLAQFHNSVRNTVKNARFMALKHFPSTVAIALLTIFPVVCAFFIRYSLEWEILLFALFGFALIAYLNALLLVKIFDKYINEDNA